jgi:hypothetical protein
MNSFDRVYAALSTERFPLPSEGQVARLEQALGVPLPSHFRQFLLQYNGGYFNEPCIVPPDKSSPYGLLEDCVDFLSGIGGTHSEMAKVGSTHALGLFDDNDPPRILPIGYTIMGNLLLLVVEQGAADAGDVRVKLADKSQSYFLAHTMEGFFDLLHESSE